MKILVYSCPVNGEFCVLSADNLSDPNEKLSLVHALLDQYEVGKAKYHIEDGELLAYGNAMWIILDLQDDAESYGKAIRTACDEFGRAISKFRPNRKENNEANGN